MTGLSLTKQALFVLGREKPHTSITDLIEILTSPSYENEAFDGIPELVESINLQSTGPAEASRAIRKKLKHGDAHRQYRALVLLKATVENGGSRYQRTFADEQLIDAIKNLVADPDTDAKVRRKLISMLGAWHAQFQGDSQMAPVANLYRSVPRPRTSTESTASVTSENDWEQRQREGRASKEEARRKAKEAKEEGKRKKERTRLRGNGSRRQREPFNFEKERPQILQTIAETSQAANNLVNALTLVNPEHGRIEDNAKVKEYLENAKAARKRVIRYIQLVENEELIGTLLETNERVVGAFQMYEKLTNPQASAGDVQQVQDQLAAVQLNNTSKLGKPQEMQRAAVEREISRSKGRSYGRDSDAYSSSPPPASLHPDLQDLSFGELGANQGELPPPMRPDDGYSSDEGAPERRADLSEFSDYDSSDEEMHNNRHTSSPPLSSSKPYSAPLLDSRVEGGGDARRGLLQSQEDIEDPFADPFADTQEVTTPGIMPKKGMDW